MVTQSHHILLWVCCTFEVWQVSDILLPQEEITYCNHCRHTGHWKITKVLSSFAVKPLELSCSANLLILINLNVASLFCSTLASLQGWNTKPHTVARFSVSPPFVCTLAMTDWFIRLPKEKWSKCLCYRAGPTLRQCKQGRRASVLSSYWDHYPS